ncbi:hypothetical protein [Vibrio pectenicida]|uniref:Uncharacterized protein n=1 Tax=Vibrio pectenicida TaxID=62763 RepID=A0A3R9EGZ7_9VIBR|nr:hypothetical protein [Vibrio pectenicida]RSD31356.1 hypothetical protein EJA03_09055 [Vibrio pectenicida]
MVERLLALGYLDTNGLPPNSQWQGFCASRLLRWLKSEHYVTIGIKMSPPNHPSWSKQATLVLAAFEYGWDCSIEHCGDDWVLWYCYSNTIDDEVLVSSMKMQLALAHYLEQEMLTSFPANRPRIWRSKL